VGGVGADTHKGRNAFLEADIAELIE